MTKSEVKELPKILNSEEKLLGIAEGVLDKIHGRDVTGQGIIVVTNRRIIFFRKAS